MHLLAKPVLDDKFWVVEDEGTTIATIQATDKGVVLVSGQYRESYPSIKVLADRHQIHFDSPPKKTKTTHEIYNFPCSSLPYNAVWDVKRKLPIFTKESDSKSYFCAGYYSVKTETEWVSVFCPKSITLNRHAYKGPFVTFAQADAVTQDNNA